MAFNLPPPPVANDPSDPSFRDWFYKLINFLSQPLDLSNASGILDIDNGGTGLGTTPTNGQVLIGNGTGYTLNTITAGSNITVTNGAGTITIASTGGGGNPSNSLSIDTTIATDTSYVVIGYFNLNGFTLTVNGNMEIL